VQTNWRAADLKTPNVSIAMGWKMLLFFYLSRYIPEEEKIMKKIKDWSSTNLGGRIIIIIFKPTSTKPRA